MGKPYQPSCSTVSSEWSDTPVVHKATRDVSHLSETLPTSRQTVLADLGHAVPEVSVAFFFESVCPRISSRDDLLVDKVLSRLTTGSNTIIDDETGRWMDFVVSPSESSQREDLTFKPLEDLIKVIGDAAVNEDPDFTPHFVFENSPYVSPASDHWNSSSRPDGYFRVRGSEQEGEQMAPHWKDIALSAEYKKYTLKETRDDVVAKVIWGMRHSMREDPRRRFTFGLTIEDSETRLWYASRADVMVTEAFDFLKDYRSLVHLVLAFLSADFQDVGYDLTMAALLDDKGNALLDPDNKPRFDITVHAEDGSETIFRTMRLISFIGTAALQGRGTRVWEARRVKAGKESGDPVVLKDCWVDSDRFREGTVMKMIRQSAANDEGRKVLDDHLLTVACSGDVHVNSGVDDHTRDLMTKGKEISLKSGNFSLRVRSDKSTQKTTASTSQSDRRAGTQKGSGRKESSDMKRGSNTAPKGSAGHHRDGEPPRQDNPRRYYQYHPKAHYRIVFEEVCNALYQETSLIPIFNYLSQTALVLKFLHAAGWVHRDLSTGNILIFDGKVKLADFEYAKQLDDHSDPHDIRAGTADFTSIEVDQKEYFFRPQMEEVDPEKMFAILKAEREGSQILRQNTQPDEVAFRYNPLHDFESLWWISVHWLFTKSVIKIDQDVPPPHDHQKQRLWAARVFYSLGHRQSTLSTNSSFQSAIGGLSPVLKLFGRTVEILRMQLIRRYTAVEVDLSKIPSRVAAGDIPGHFILLFGELGCRKGDILLGHLPDTDPATPSVQPEPSGVQPQPPVGPAPPKEQPKPEDQTKRSKGTHLFGEPHAEQHSRGSRVKKLEGTRMQTRSMTANKRAENAIATTRNGEAISAIVLYDLIGMGEQPVTPPRSHKPLETQSDTPFVHKATRDISHLSETLPASRQTVLADLGDAVPEVSVAFFFESVCPRISSQDDLLVDKVLSRLTTGSNKIINDETGRWADFVISPSESSKREDPTFKPLEDLMKAIGDAAVDEDPDFQFNYVFENSPSISPASDHWNSASRPDGYFRARKLGKALAPNPHWKDIVLSAEYKKYTMNETRDDVVSKVIWGMHHSFREDPRRRFTFGLTIEDSEMRLWYASRADVMVTQAFDFLTDHRTLIHLALAFLSADAQDVGYDPTMKALVDTKGNSLLDAQDKPRFDITVHAEDGTEVIFRTTRLLSFIGTAALQGRGTRVWEAKRVEHGRESGDSVVLKDCWVDSDRLREGTIMKMIRESKISEEGRRVLDEHLLTVVSHGDVRMRGNFVDHTRELMTQGKEISLKSGTFLLRTRPVNVAQETTNGTTQDNRRSETQRASGSKPGSGRSDAKRRSNTAPKGDAGHHRHDEQGSVVEHHQYYHYHPKAHYRIVFQEVCTALHYETSLFPIFGYLSQTATVLRFLHEAGWVHRDLSTGNILIYNGRVKLADFEYAKRLGAVASHEIRTGTADFMAVEVDLQNYYFKERHLNLDIYKFAAAYPVTREQSVLPPAESMPVAFRYNPLHDFESLWWMSVYFLLNKKIRRVDQKNPPPHQYVQQRIRAAEIFYSLASRKSALSWEPEFQFVIESLSPSVHNIGEAANVLRSSLVARYREIERDTENIGHTAAGTIHEDFAVIFGVVARTPGEILIGPLPRKGSRKKVTGSIEHQAEQSREPKKALSQGSKEGDAAPNPLERPQAQRLESGTRIKRMEGLPPPMQTRSKTRQLAASAKADFEGT
ncbi:uncharacterized protein FIBRA_05827 [Fibroporia radiculosa]|uniref:Protein kinase domain-containing protein n=1 Tax=Fibroporia radiculosa TaxID=599839 RepID=J4GA65_9APHY|nr:uncharacterized protein FIBRA_05827 [Fibroporia radiculosa]CCM03683.1 predicted protein [Fibroporia radiculosa]